MKTTRATIKKFIKQAFEKDSLFIKNESSFSGMTDCVEDCSQSSIRKAEKDTSERRSKMSLGVHGAWFVGESRDHFTPYEDKKYIGYSIYNCCGSFLLLTNK